MALFKICRGNESNLPETLTDGYAYFCTDTGNFYIDWADAEANVSRKHINAEYATKLRFKDENEEWIEIDAKDLHDMLGFKQVQADWEQTDPTASSYILNRPFGLMPDLYSGTKTSTAVDGKTNLYQLSSGIGIDLEEGKTYELIWDGTSYSSVYRKVKLHSSVNTDAEVALLGNANLLASFWTGQETMSVINDDYPSEAPFLFNNWYQLSSDGGTHTVIVRGSGDAALKKLDVKYLPDSVATQDFVVEQIENIDIDQVQVDWDENDPSAKGYILNRPFGALPNLFEATLNVTEDNIVVDGVYKADNTVNITRECVVGDTYNVFWRGAKYVCEFQRHTAHGPTGGSVGIDHLGNISLFAALYPDWTIDGESNGLPFFIWGSTVLVNYPDHGTLVVSRDDATNFTKLDAKYLPDEAATKDFVMEQVASLDTEQVNADWNEVDSTKASYILNRPFGLIQDILGQESYEFSHANNGSTAYRCGTASQTSVVITSPIHAQLQVGEIYIVIWDNVPYECVLANVPMTGPNSLVGTCPILGNPTLLNRYDSRWNYAGEDNNCPFVLSLIFDIAETKGAHTVAIRAKNNFTKLDVKYLPDEAATKEYVQEALADVDFEQIQADWKEDDYTSKAYIANKPILAPVATKGTFAALKGKQFHVGDIPAFAEASFTFKEEQDNALPNVFYANLESNNSCWLVLGEAYTVIWDGEEYTCVCASTEELGGIWAYAQKNLYLGNGAIATGLSQAPDTGEPFLIIGDESEFVAYTLDNNSKHTISITPINDVIKLDKKYLPDDLATEKFVEDKIANIKVSGGGTVELQVDLIPEQEVNGFHSAAEYGNLTVSERGWASLNATPFDLKIGDQCIVVWQGVEYKCTVFDVSSVQSGALAIGNGSNFGLTSNDEPFAIAWTTNGITFFALDNFDNTPRTIRVYQTKVSPVGGISSWNDLTDKPFYEEEVVVFEGEFQGAKYDSDGDGVMDAWEDMMFAPYNNEDPLVVGQTYTFYWDGVKYTSECYSLMGVGAIGFNAITSEGMSAYPVAMGLDISGMTTGGTPAWIAMHAIAPTDISHSGLHSCKIIGQETKKIDDKYQHQPDWDETDVNRASFVKNKPFGVVSKAGILYESDVAYDSNDFGFMMMDFASELHIGGNYKVSVNGVSYTGVCEGAGSLDDGAITYTHLVRLNADGQATLGLVCNPTLVEVGVTISATLAPEKLLGDTRWENGEVCHIVISAMDEIVATVPHKYLDFIESGTTEIIPQTSISLVCEEDNAPYMGGFEADAKEYQQFLAVTAGETYCVNWNGVKYACVAQDMSDIYAQQFGDDTTINAAIALGNTNPSGEENPFGLSDTGEPFLLLQLETIGANEVSMLSIQEIPGTVGETVNRTFSITKTGQYKIKEEYLPEIHAEPAEIPYFDLIAMGLPEIPLDGTAVGVECDTSSLREAASKGLIKTTLRVAGLGVTIDSICSMMYLREVDQYLYSAIGMFGSAPSIIEFIVTATAIQVRCVPLAGGTTTTMTDVSKEGA